MTVYSAGARPWLDATRPVEERVELLLAALTLEEKAGQLTMRPNVDAVDDRASLVATLVGSTLYASGAPRATSETRG